MRMDLAQLDSVREAAAEVLETVPRIDALICNAAIAQVPTQKLTVDGFESMLGTNHYGHFLLSGLLFERIEESKGRIVVVASLGYKMGIKTIQFDDMNWDKNYHQNKTYSQSKLAQMMFAYELQDRLAAANKDVKVYVCHPGSSRTSLITTSGNLMTRVMFRLMSMSPMVQSAEKGPTPRSCAPPKTAWISGNCTDPPAGTNGSARSGRAHSSPSPMTSRSSRGCGACQRRKPASIGSSDPIGRHDLIGFARS